MDDISAKNNKAERDEESHLRRMRTNTVQAQWLQTVPNFVFVVASFIKKAMDAIGSELVV